MRLQSVGFLSDAMIRDGISLSRSVKLTARWDEILRVGPVNPVTKEDFQSAEISSKGSLCIGGTKLSEVGNFGCVRIPWFTPTSASGLTWFPPAPFLQCTPHLAPGGSGVLADPARIDEEFRKAWPPYFCCSGKKEASFEEFDAEVDGWLPLPLEVSLPQLSWEVLAEVVHPKSANAGSLDGLGWRELKVLPVFWFNGLARVLSQIEEDGVWPEGLLGAWIATIPNTDGVATPLGQRPFSVLPVVYRIWASVRMGQLEDWFRCWVPDSVFSGGGGRGSVEAWYAAALDFEEVLTRALDSDVHLFVADVIKSSDTVDGCILDRVLSSLGLPAWFRHAYFEYHSHV